MRKFIAFVTISLSITAGVHAQWTEQPDGRVIYERNSTGLIIYPESNPSGTHVMSGQSLNLIFNSNSVGTDKFTIRNNGDNLSNSTELFSILNTGKIGIGSTNYVGAVNINSAGLGGARGIIIQRTEGDYANTQASIGISSNTSAAGLRIQLSTDNWTTYKDVLFLQETGRVGIGTPNPTETLSVKGTVRAQEVKVEASPWPDYVFSKDYELTSLEETESFIQQNGHLPEVPSAQQVSEEGISLGEMNAILLKKIEELTLHVIELKKSDDEKSTIIEQLKTEVESLKQNVK